MDEEDDDDEDGEMTLIDQGIDPNDEEWHPGDDDDEDHHGKSKKSKKYLDKTMKQQKQSTAGKLFLFFLETIEFDWKYVFFPSQ